MYTGSASSPQLVDGLDFPWYQDKHTQNTLQMSLTETMSLELSVKTQSPTQTEFESDNSYSLLLYQKLPTV